MLAIIRGEATCGRSDSGLAPRSTDRKTSTSPPRIAQAMALNEAEASSLRSELAEMRKTMDAQAAHIADLKKEVTAQNLRTTQVREEV